MQGESFSVSFGGESKINAFALAQILQSMAILTQHCVANSPIGGQCRLEVCATKEGSFEVFLGLIVDNISPLFQALSSSNFNLVLSTMVHVFDLRKHLGGEPAKETIMNQEGCLVVNEKGVEKQFNTQTMNTYNAPVQIGNNNTLTINSYPHCPKCCNVSDLVSGVIVAAKGGGRSGLKIKAGIDEFFLEEEEFDEMILPSKEEALKGEKMEKLVIVWLDVKRPDLVNAKAQWQFVYSPRAKDENVNDVDFFVSGTKFSAKIADENFIRKEEEGQLVFAKNPRLFCVLKIVYFSPEVGAVPSDARAKYEVVEVKKFDSGLEAGKQGVLPNI